MPTGTADGSTVTTNATVSNSDNFINDPDSSDDNATVGTGVQASGVAQTVGVTPSSKDFGSQRVNTTSTAQTFTITNHDSAPLHISTAALAGTNPDQFSQPTNTDTCSNQAILPNQSCTVAVAFTPTTTGAQTANLEITSDAPSSPTEIVLHGSGTQSVISASPSSASFGNENVNRTSPSQNFQITNNGTATLHIGLATLGGNDASQYVEATDGCSHVALNGGQSCTVSLAFRPTSTGAQNDATLDISSDDPGGTFHIALSGSGVAPTVSPTPLTKSFASQPINSTGAAQTFQIKNTGNAALTISSITLAGADSAQYALSNNTCPSQLATNATCTVNVAFAPTTAGPHNSATLNIASDDPSGTFHITLFGTGLAYTVSVTAQSTDFGNLRVGTTGPTQTFDVKNVGASILTISGVALGGTDSDQYTITSNDCTTPLGANAKCTVGVAFAPTRTGTHNAATLDVSSDGAPAVDQVSLSGTGILGAISPSMTSHDFGNQRVGTTSSVAARHDHQQRLGHADDLGRRARRRRRRSLRRLQRHLQQRPAARGIEVHGRHRVQTDEHRCASGRPARHHERRGHQRHAHHVHRHGHSAERHAFGHRPRLRRPAGRLDQHLSAVHDHEHRRRRAQRQLRERDRERRGSVPGTGRPLLRARAWLRARRARSTSSSHRPAWVVIPRCS